MSRGAAEYAWSSRLDVFARMNPGASIVAKLSNGHEVSGTLRSAESGSGYSVVGDWTVQHSDIVAWKAITA